MTREKAELIEFVQNLTLEQAETITRRLATMYQAIQEGWDTERMRQEIKSWSEREGV